MRKIYPAKLKVGDEIRIVAPSRSLPFISKENLELANQRLAEMGLKLSFGKNVEEIDEFDSSSVASRVEDLHEAFLDAHIKAIFVVIGGYNCNQLLKYLDWNLIRKNPKIFCGYSDTTALLNAIYAKSGLITYHGPQYVSFAQPEYFDYTLEYFKTCLFSDKPYDILPSKDWSDDHWWKNEKINQITNPGWLIINEGEASGVIFGGNLDTFNLLQGTEYFPDLKNSILFIEDDARTTPAIFDRDLQSLLHLPEFKKVKGLVLGRFQKASEMSNEKLIKIIKTKKELAEMPIIANVDFGHTDPKITFPIGGFVDLVVSQNLLKIRVGEH